MWTDAVGGRVNGQWPDKAALVAKKEAVDKAAGDMYNAVTTVTKKPIPYLHDVAWHNEKYAEKDCHTRNAEGEEGKNKGNKELGRGNSNGKEQDTCTTIMKTNAVQEHLATSTPSPHSQHLRRVLEHGMQRTATKLDSKLSLHYGYSPNTAGPPTKFR